MNFCGVFWMQECQYEGVNISWLIYRTLQSLDASLWGRHLLMELRLCVCSRWTETTWGFEFVFVFLMYVCILFMYNVYMHWLFNISKYSVFLLSLQSRKRLYTIVSDWYGKALRCFYSVKRNRVRLIRELLFIVAVMQEITANNLFWSCSKMLNVTVNG